MSSPTSSDKILKAFALEPTYDQETIGRYIARYPELATDFVDLLVDLRLAAEVAPAAIPPESAASLEASFARLMGADADPSVANLFAPFKGQAFVTLAKGLNVPRAFLTAVRDRLLISTSVPPQFVTRLATAMEEVPEKVRSYLLLPPVSDAALNFRADGQPGEAKQVSFTQLVDDTDMDDVQRALLRQDLIDDGCK